MPLEPRRIGDYEVLARLGAGGMGEVYKVRNAISGRIEALKMLLPDLASAPELAERFLREIQVQASLQHPHIAGLHTALRIDNRLYMVIEYMEGETLKEILDRGPMDLTGAVAVTRHVLSALGYAHQYGVVHRDVKPSNIMLTPARVAKLMDFGIASTAEGHRITRSGAAMGSLHYMAPEQISGRALDGRADLYSLGITLYQLVTNRLPFDGDSEYAIMNGHQNVRPQPPSRYCPWLPPVFSDVVLKALEKDPAQRFQSAYDFYQALNFGASAATPVPATAASITAQQIELARRHLAAFIGPIAGVLVTRAARKAHTLPELYNLLAPEIAADADRARFLRSINQP